MEIKNIFDDLESNQTQECEDAKRSLVEMFQQIKEQWLVHNMLDYYLKTGSQRILEVLVKVQAPHDGYIFDRLSDWLKAQTHRMQALQLFFFIVRKHPTWLFKVDKHRLIKDIFKLLSTEKEIVPLMCALLCIITLLPIMPSLVPTFREELFSIFGHLASWKCQYQYPNGLPDDKFVHLQFGLQILFHRLYGMYPWNFLAYLSEFIKEKDAIFHHTIKPLLETVRIHPLLVTATIESENNNARWKQMEPHDVVVECAKLSLPVMHQDFNADHTQHLSDLLKTPGGPRSTPTIFTSSEMTTTITTTTTTKRTGVGSYYSQQQIRELQKRRGSIARFDNTNINSGIWSPFNEITATGPIPLTPTPSYMLPQSSTTINSQLLGVSGSSPPEAAVEATPETTPLKDIREFKHSALTSGPALATPHAVRAIFPTSQPPSPMRKESNQFSFPDVSGASIDSRPASNREIGSVIVNPVHITSSHDRQLIMQLLPDRTQSPFQTIETLTAKQGYLSPYDTSSKCDTPEVDSELSGHMSDVKSQHTPTTTTPLSIMPTPTPTPTPTPVEPITKTCDDCNETERSLCSAGGLQMPTSRSMQMLAKGIKRRNRMASYCYNEASCEKNNVNNNVDKTNALELDSAKVRRTKSCSSIYTAASKASKTDDEMTDNESNGVGATPKKIGSRLQKSSKMLAIPTVTKQAMMMYANAATQTLQTLPNDYEQYLYELLFECKQIRTDYESNLRYPQEILDQFILRSKESYRSETMNHREQYQLVCLQLQFERYRREIHAERNRRLMGRSRDKRSLEMERDRLREQLSNFAATNKELVHQIDKAKKAAIERENGYEEEINNLKAKYHHELDQNKCLRQANELLQTRLNTELSNRKSINTELESLRGQIFNLTSELQHAQHQADIGLQYKQELTRLEAEFIIMGEVQVKCRDRLNEVNNFRARDEELQMLQETYNLELKEQKRNLLEKTSQFESVKHKMIELQAQLVNNEKCITDQKRFLRTVKDEYEEKFKALNKKYDVQKTIMMQMEEKLLMSLQTDIGSSSVERNSPLSTSQASSESISLSLRSTELRNLQQLVEIPIAEASNSTVMGAGINVIEGARLPSLDLASSANTATTTNLMATVRNTYDLETDMDISAAPSKSKSSAIAGHVHPHAHLQLQQQQKQHHQQQHQQQQQLLQHQKLKRL